RRRFLFLRARHRDGHDRDVLVTEDFHARGRFDFPDVNRAIQFELADVDDDLFGQILGEGADFELEQDVFENAAAVLNTGSFAFGFDWHHDHDLLVFGNLWKSTCNTSPLRG